MTTLTLIADAATVARAAPATIAAPLRVRISTRDDLQQLGLLYFRSYETGEACATEAAAIADVAASFDGDYGEYLHSASPVVVSDSTIVAAAMTVNRAPWADTPACPFIIEVFTDPSFRRQGLATALLGSVANEIVRFDHTIGLRVDEQNAAALALYDTLGFVCWQSPDQT